MPFTGFHPTWHYSQSLGENPSEGRFGDDGYTVFRLDFPREPGVGFLGAGFTLTQGGSNGTIIRVVSNENQNYFGQFNYSFAIDGLAADLDPTVKDMEWAFGTNQVPTGGALTVNDYNWYWSQTSWTNGEVKETPDMAPFWNTYIKPVFYPGCKIYMVFWPRGYNTWIPKDFYKGIFYGGGSYPNYTYFQFEYNQIGDTVRNMELFAEARGKVGISWPQYESETFGAARSKLEMLIQYLGGDIADFDARSKLAMFVGEELEKTAPMNARSKLDILIDTAGQETLSAAARSKLAMALGFGYTTDPMAMNARSKVEMVLGRVLYSGFDSGGLSKVGFDVFNYTQWKAQDKWRSILRHYARLFDNLGNSVVVRVRNYELYFTDRENSSLTVTIPWDEIDNVLNHLQEIQLEMSYWTGDVESLRAPILKEDITGIDMDEDKWIRLKSNFVFNVPNRHKATYDESISKSQIRTETTNRIRLSDPDPYMRPGDYLQTGEGQLTISQVQLAFGPTLFQAEVQVG